MWNAACFAARKDYCCRGLTWACTTTWNVNILLDLLTSSHAGLHAHAAAIECGQQSSWKNCLCAWKYGGVGADHCHAHIFVWLKLNLKQPMACKFWPVFHWKQSSMAPMYWHVWAWWLICRGQSNLAKVAVGYWAHLVDAIGYSIWDKQFIHGMLNPILAEVGPTYTWRWIRCLLHVYVL